MEAKGKTDVLSEAQLSALVTLQELASLTKELASPGLLLLWLPEASAEHLEIECGTAFRFKTEGNSPFICESSFSTLCHCIFILCPFICEQDMDL